MIKTNKDFFTQFISHMENPTSIILQQELTEEQTAAMPIQLKSKHKPFATYCEFLCLTNNITYNVYIPGMDPFDKFDFTKPIHNPATKPEYRKYYELNTFIKWEPPTPNQ